jgi:hypothetical protein
MAEYVRKYVSLSWIPLCILAGLISINLGQDDCGDLRNYHYYNAFSFFHHSRSHDIDVAGLQGFLNPVLDFPYYLLTVVFPRSPRTVAFFMGLPVGLLAYFTLLTGLRLFAARPYGWLAALLALIFGLSGTSTFSQLGLSTNEVFTGALVVAGLYCLLKAIDSKASGFSPLVIAAGFLVGLAVGGKLTAGPYAIALAAATIAGFNFKKIPITLFAVGVGGIAGVSLTGGFWMIHLYLLYQNPIFPYHNDIFQSKWAAPFAYVNPRFFPNPGLQTILYPFWWIQLNANLVTEYPFQDSRIASIFIVCALSALMFAFRFRTEKMLIPRIWRAVIAFWLAAYVLWMEAFSIYRYAVPVEVVGAFLYVGGIGYLFRSERAFGTTLSAVGLCVLAVFTTYPDWGHIPFQARSFPVVPPIIPDHTLVIDSDYYPMSYVATLGGRSARFVDARFNYAVPPSSPLTKLVTDTISNWDGPIDVLGTVAGGQPALDLLKRNHNIITTTNCDIIKSAWDNDALQLCEAYRQQAGRSFQPAIALSFGESGNSSSFVGSGWSSPESWGRWSVGSDADILMPINPLNKRKLLLTAICKGFVGSQKDHIGVELFVNDHLIETWNLGPNLNSYSASIPPQSGTDIFILRFKILNPKSPLSLSESDDSRVLGIGVHQIILQDVSD